MNYDNILNKLDRCSVKRSDSKWVLEQFNSDASRIIPVHQSAVLCKNDQQAEAVFVNGQQLNNSPELADHLMFLGVAKSISYFAIDITSAEQAVTLSQQNNATFQELKSIITLFDAFNSELFSLACFIAYWHRKSQYCGKCGSLTSIAEAGHQRICQNEQCLQQYYPTMDPAIIVLVSSDLGCLLGRQKEWPDDMHSTLAGFVEPGESIEQAVQREIHEEAGIEVDQIKYQHSQSWLFPNSLMLGFTAVAKQQKLNVDYNELEDARWFSRQEIRDNSALLPYKNSIAYQLIMEWLEKKC